MIPIWTAFVTQYIGRGNWMKRVGSCTVQFRELHPYMFTDGYKLPKGPTGRYQLTFTTPEGMFMVVSPSVELALLTVHRPKKLHGDLPSHPSQMSSAQASGYYWRKAALSYVFSFFSFLAC